MRYKISFLLSLTLVFTLAPISTWAFEAGPCNGTASMLLASCGEKSGLYQCTTDFEKKQFGGACQVAANIISQKCLRETSCPAFLGFLNNPDSVCGSMQPAPKKYGCREMFKEWREAKLPFCPAAGFF